MNEQWYCVRCVFDLGPSRDSGGNRRYEERLVLIRATSFADAIAKAEAEAKEYEGNGTEYTGLAQGFMLFEELVENGFQHGTEVFSLIRDSELEREEYLDNFFDTGKEYQQPNLAD